MLLLEPRDDDRMENLLPLGPFIVILRRDILTSRAWHLQDLARRDRRARVEIALRRRERTMPRFREKLGQKFQLEFFLIGLGGQLGVVVVVLVALLVAAGFAFFRSLVSFLGRGLLSDGW